MIEQQIDQGKNRFEIEKKKKNLKGTHLHCTWMLISLVLSVANIKKKKNVSVKYEMGVALYGCEPRILKYCSGTVEGRMKKESEDKWCNNIVRWCRFGVKRNACESMAEV